MRTKTTRKLKFSRRVEGIAPSASVSIADRIRAMKSNGLNIIELQTGEPDFPTPGHIVKAGYEAMNQGYTHYVSSRGLADLRVAIAEKLERENGIGKPNPASEILVTVGAVHGVFCALMAILNPGDEVIVFDPCWVAYEGCIAIAGGKLVRVPYTGGDFRVNVTRFRNAITSKTRLAVFNFPANPTGTVPTLDELKELADIAEQQDILILSDEVYEKIVFDGIKTYSVASFRNMKDRTIVVNSFSKTYAMTGWRVGYVWSNKNIIDQILKVQQYSVTCAPAFAQKAALEAIKGPQDCVYDMIEEYKRRRKVIVEGLNSIKGISCCTPRGTFYVFADISRLFNSSEEASEYLLEKAMVGTVPGSAYGPAGEGYIRFSFANSVENLEESIYRIQRAIKNGG